MRSRNHFKALQRKKYEARRFNNPYFSHGQKRNWKGIAGVLVCFALIAAVTGWMFGSARFAIQTVTVNGNESISGDQLSGQIWNRLHERRFLFFHATNRFLFDAERLREDLTAAYSFESLEIARTCSVFGAGGCALNVTVKEKTFQLLWRSSDRVYLADLQGTVIRELSEEEIASLLTPKADPVENQESADAVQNQLKRLPVFFDLNSMPVTIGANVLSPDEISNIFVFHQRIQGLGIVFGQTDIDRLVGKWMAIQTQAGYRILFDPSGDVNSQADRLAVLLRDTVKDTSGLEYIDLRFGDHIYYK